MKNDVYISFYPWTIQKRTEVYTRTASGKSWTAKPAETMTENVTREHYLNFVNSTRFFNGLFGGTARNYYGYTAAGYIPVKCTSVNPSRTEKHVVTFKFE